MTVEYTETEDTKAAGIWRTIDLPCAPCCGPWIGFVRRKWRQLSLSADPPLSLGGTEPPINSVMVIYRDGCYAVCVPPEYPTTCEPFTTETDRDNCLQVFADAITSAEGEVTTADDAVAAAEASLVTVQGDLAAAETNVSSTQSTMVSQRADISSLQLDLYGLKIREQYYITIGDTPLAEATAVLIADLQTTIDEHPYWDALEDYNNAVIDLGTAQDNVFAVMRSLDELTRKKEIADENLVLAQSNETTALASSAPDEEMYVLTLADDGRFLNNGNEITLLSSGTEREGWYILGLDLSQLVSSFINTIPLPSENTQFRFKWREVFKPADTLDPFVYSDPFEEVVEVAADTLYGLTAQHHIESPSIEGKHFVISPPQKAIVAFVSELQGGSKYKTGFMAYKTDVATEAKFYRQESASGGTGFSGSQVIEDDGSITDTFSDDVPDNMKSLVWPPDMQQEPKPVSKEETNRVFSNGLQMSLTDEITTTDIQDPVNAYVIADWGEDPPADIDPPRFSHAHQVLQANESSYSRAKFRYKLQVTIPQALPFDVTITCTWKQAVLDWATGEWLVSDEERDVTVPAGDTEFTEEDWTEVNASAGELIALHTLEAEEHPDVFYDGPIVTVEPITP